MAKGLTPWVTCPFCDERMPASATREQWEHVGLAHRDAGPIDTPWRPDAEEQEQTVKILHVVTRVAAFERLTRILCVAAPDERPCGSCTDAAIRVWSSRDEVRTFLAEDHPHEVLAALQAKGYQVGWVARP